MDEAQEAGKNDKKRVVISPDPVEARTLLHGLDLVLEGKLENVDEQNSSY